MRGSIHLLLVLLLFAVAAQASSSSISNMKRDGKDIYVPLVTYPHDGTVWTIKNRHNVTWDTSHPPANISNPVGTIMLRKGDVTTPLILEQGFDILAGAIEVTVPWVVDGDDYRIVLIGDEGNWSSAFTISS